MPNIRPTPGNGLGQSFPTTVPRSYPVSVGTPPRPPSGANTLPRPRGGEVRSSGSMSTIHLADGAPAMQVEKARLNRDFTTTALVTCPRWSCDASALKLSSARSSARRTQRVAEMHVLQELMASMRTWLGRKRRAMAYHPSAIPPVPVFPLPEICPECQGPLTDPNGQDFTPLFRGASSPSKVCETCRVGYWLEDIGWMSVATFRVAENSRRHSPRRLGHPFPPYGPLNVATRRAARTGQAGDGSVGESIGGTPRRPVWLSPDLERRGTNRRRTGRRNVCRRCWRGPGWARAGSVRS